MRLNADRYELKHAEINCDKDMPVCVMTLFPSFHWFCSSKKEKQNHMFES